MKGDFRAELESLVGPAALLVTPTDKAGYRGDLAHPEGEDFLAVVRPRSTGQVAAVMRLCQTHGIVVTPRGGGTGLAGGATPTDPRPGIVLSFERMNRVRALDQVEGSIIVDAGVTLQAAQCAAREAGWLLALDHGGSGSSQIGGNLSTNAGGNNVLRYGMARGQTLGIEAVLADGTVLDLLAPLRKNNAGYDLKQFLIGSEGTLGLITAASLRLRPLPWQRATGLVGLATLDDVLSLFTLVQRTIGECVTAFELVPRAGLELHFENTQSTREPLAMTVHWYVLIEADTVVKRFDVEAALASALEDTIASNLAQDAVLAKSE